MTGLSLPNLLTVYGPLGILALIGILAAVKMFRVVKSEREARDSEIKALNAQHKQELQAMVDRYISTTTSQVEQYHNLAEKLHAVVEAFRRRVDRGG